MKPPTCYGGEEHPPEDVENRYCNKCGEHWDEINPAHEDLVKRVKRMRDWYAAPDLETKSEPIVPLLEDVIRALSER